MSNLLHLVCVYTGMNTHTEIASKVLASRNPKRAAEVVGLVVVTAGAAVALNLALATHPTQAAPGSTPAAGTATTTAMSPTLSTMTVLDEAKIDVDGDGTAETVRLLAPVLPGDDQVLEVGWGGGATQRAGLPANMERALGVPLALDAVGGREIVVQGGGGETSEIRVFTVIDGQLGEVSYVDSGARTVPGLFGAAESPEWGVMAGPAGIYSVRNPSLTPLPAPVQVRAWTLSDRALSESAATTTGCLRQDGLSLKPC